VRAAAQQVLTARSASRSPMSAGARIPADKKSVAYSLTYRSAERTLTADEVNAAHARLKDRLKSALSVTLRE